jgi:prolyl oligopeptidase PreP (S9A serine peptidase family)
MKISKTISLLIFALFQVLMPTSCVTNSRISEPIEDNFIFLEKEQEKTKSFVNEHNQKTKDFFAARVNFANRFAINERILKAQEGIPDITFFGDWAFTILKDDASPKGRLVRTPISKLAQSFNNWTLVFDTKILKKNRVISDFNCLLPEAKRCLVSLSEAGGDKVEIIEVEAKTGKIVTDGFFVPLARSRVSWINKDKISLSTDFGPDSLTASGDGNQVKVVSRGQQFKDGKLVLSLLEGYQNIYIGNYLHQSKSIVVASQFASPTKNSFWLIDQQGNKKIPTKGAAIFYGIYKNFLIFQSWTNVNYGDKKIGKGEV